MEKAKMEIIAFSNDDVIATSAVSGHALTTLKPGMTEAAYVAESGGEYGTFIRYESFACEHSNVDTPVFDSLGNQIGDIYDSLVVGSYYHIVQVTDGDEYYFDGAQLCDNSEHHYMYQ